MPKENLNWDRILVRSAGQLTVLRKRDDVPPVTADGSSMHEQALLVQLHWNPDNYAQYSVTLDKAAVQKALEEDPELSTIQLYGECLDRREMNEAIRALRRARGAVHGVDE